MHTITLLTQDPRWRGLAPTVRRAAAHALSLKPGAKKQAVTILLSNDAQVQTLNRHYRGKNKPTNVLSFPNGDLLNGVIQLGDMALAYETLAREAAAQNKKLKHHLTHLTIHGILHLLGYDHEEEKAAIAMESLEITLLARMGIANPYETA